ncbi:Protein of unknown function [Pseudomonas cuatrocienegasensis]|uniref:DUF2804 domain-containing protein n=1 Tax=Pseudomonas cuatrocienegasensis TaxID=543360 RepID=A0ABY1BPV7_9PSED|nr:MULTISPECIES: DUF2804 domain-containing protein [Pseudomonas]OEC32783.1 hypothetical protein A7D25_22455 [Pseudomonas sp. 21C1]SER33492.1 Protein of unknown function [Pseudomonas cuatrocienegasensis]
MNSFTHTLPQALPLCGTDGRLNPDAIGWSPRPRTDCALPGRPGRRKRWNHWCITTPDWMLTVTQADLDYLGYGALYFLDLHTGESASHHHLCWFGRGGRLPDQPFQNHAFSHPKLQLQVGEHLGRARLTAAAGVTSPRALQVALDVQRPSHLDSVNLVAPMANGCFHATCRQLALPVTGSIRLGTREYACAAGQSFAAMDFGRGILPLHTHWTRAAFAAPGGIAGNFGAGWTEHSGLSENALWFGGELEHLPLQVRIEQDLHNPLAPWRLSTADERVALVFTPLQRHHRRPRFGPFFADTQQWFGHYDGLLRSPDGERVPVTKAVGWIGSTNARW